MLRLPRDRMRVARDAIDRLEEEIAAMKGAEKGMLKQLAALDCSSGVESKEALLSEQKLLKEVEKQLQGLKRDVRRVAQRNFEQWVDAQRVKVGQRAGRIDGCICSQADFGDWSPAVREQVLQHVIRHG